MWSPHLARTSLYNVDVYTTLNGYSAQQSRVPLVPARWNVGLWAAIYANCGSMQELLYCTSPPTANDSSYKTIRNKHKQSLNIAENARSALQPDIS